MGYGNEGDDLTYSPDGRYLAMVGREKDNSCICIWDVSTGNLHKVLAQEKELNLHSEEVTPYALPNVIFSPDGRHIAVAIRLDEARFIKIWDVTTWKLVGTLPLRYGAFGNAMAYSPDGGYLAVIDESSVKVWNTRSHLLAGTLPHPEKYLRRGIAYSPDGRYIAAGGEKYIKIWDVSEYDLGMFRWKSRSDE
jgi:WD40 repeat protein